MLNALRKKLAPDDVNNAQHHPTQHPIPTTSGNSPKGSVPAGVRRVGAELQRKFAGGIDYNMKIVLRGDRNTGKTALWRRLQGLPFLQEGEDEGGGGGGNYTQTEEIQVVPITWNYRAREFVVKLDVWDVVDKGRRAGDGGTALKGMGGGGGGNRAGGGGQVPEDVQKVIGSTACDASMVNVYNGCHGVVLLFDVTREWTWAYVRRELPLVPATIPVLVMANKMDLLASGTSNNTLIEECLHFLRVFNERASSSPDPTSSATIVPPFVRFAKASMKRAQGLKYLYNFFNIPFLLLQRNFLQNALEANLREMRIAENELDMLGREEGQSPPAGRGRMMMGQKTEDEETDEEEEEDKWEEEKEEDEEKRDEEEGKTDSAGRVGGGRKKKKRKSREKEEYQQKSDVMSSSSSSEGANPHVSTYAEDIDDESE